MRSCPHLPDARRLMRRCPHLPVLCTVYNLSDIIVARVNYLNYFMEWFSQECIPQKKHLYFYERHDENGWIPGGGGKLQSPSFK